MKKILLLMVAALFLCGVTSAQNWGTPDSHAKSSNTPIVAKVTLGETVQEAGTLGAFVGDELRGLATIYTDGNFWIQAFYNEGETNPDEFTFKFYDGEQEYTNCTTTLPGQEEGYGTPNSPVELVFANEQTMTQTSTLAAGWTWWSTPIEQNGINGLQMLENSLGSNGITIKGQNNSAAYVASLNRWVGSCPITNEASYMINVSNECDMSMSGVIANPEDHPITIEPDWNWIGYPVTQGQTVVSALGNGFVPTAGDVIKDQDNSTVYLSNVLGWRPATFTFSTGCGYMYYSKASSSKTLTFNNVRGSDVDKVADNRHWHANRHIAEGNLTVLGEVYVDGELQRSEDLELGAFVNDECRGSARLLYIEPIDAYYVILTVTGEEGELVEFELYNAQDGSVNTKGLSHIQFVQNGIIGEIDSPYPISFIGHEEMLNVFPNPVERNQSFTLNIPQDEIVIQTIITDVTGTVVLQKTGSQRVQNGMSVSGVYFVKVICESGRIYTGRIIVK